MKSTKSQPLKARPLLHAALATELGLPASADESAALSAIKALKTQLNEGALTALVDCAVAAGKFAAIHRDWLLAQGRKDMAALKGLIDAAPALQHQPAAWQLERHEGVLRVLHAAASGALGPDPGVRTERKDLVALMKHTIEEIASARLALGVPPGQVNLTRITCQTAVEHARRSRGLEPLASPVAAAAGGRPKRAQARV